MENTSIIFFGKPNSFESYELKKDTIIKNNHSEPQLKLSQDDKDVLHYYVKNSFYYLELYSFANAFEAGRPGIVIGVCIKSEQPLAISERNVTTLSKLLAYFKGETLSGTMFKDSSLENYKFNLNWDTIYKTIEYAKTTFKPEQGKLTLLLVEDFEHKIQQISDKILKYSNLYISSNSKIFHELINNKEFFEAGSKFFVVDNQEIKEYKEPIVKDPPMRPCPPQKDPESDFKRLQIENGILEREKYKLKIELGNVTRKAKKLTRWLICSSAACLLIAVAFFFESDLLPNRKTNNANSQCVSLVQENSNLRTEVATLQNQLTQATSKKQSAPINSNTSSISDIVVPPIQNTDGQSNILKILWKDKNGNILEKTEVTFSTSLTLTASQPGVTWSTSGKNINIRPQKNNSVILSAISIGDSSTVTATTSDGKSATVKVKVIPKNKNENNY
jgi:hypothetical protein